MLLLKLKQKPKDLNGIIKIKQEPQKKRGVIPIYYLRLVN